MPGGQLTLQVALVPHAVVQPPAGQSTKQSAAVPQFVVQPPAPLHVTRHRALVSQFVVHLPTSQWTAHVLATPQPGVQLSVLHSKLQSPLVAQLQLASVHCVAPAMPEVPDVPDVPDVPELPEVPDVPELPPSPLPSPLPMVKS